MACLERAFCTICVVTDSLCAPVSGTRDFAPMPFATLSATLPLSVDWAPNSIGGKKQKMTRKPINGYGNVIDVVGDLIRREENDDKGEGNEDKGEKCEDGGETTVKTTTAKAKTKKKWWHKPTEWIKKLVNWIKNLFGKRLMKLSERDLSKLRDIMSSEVK